MNLDQYFSVSNRGSTVSREVVGGLTTFATMSYIVFIQPTVMGLAGMPFGSALLATCFASALACFLMGFVARFPYALAPGMGSNFFFAFAVCGAMGFSWQSALAMVFIAGVIFLLLSLVRARERMMAVLPDCLKHSIGPAIGLFIALIGLQWGGIVMLNPATMVSLGDWHSPMPVITVVSVLLVVALMARGFPGAILVGILFSAAAFLLTGVVSRPEEGMSFGTETFFALDFAPLGERFGDAMVAIFLFFFLDFFDTVGTLVGVSSQAKFLDERGQLPGAGRAFFSDATGTTVGALFGTSTVTTYIESSTGVAAGARTGLAALVTGVCFVAAPVLAPLVGVAGQNVGPDYYATMDFAQVAMYPVVAPAMIVVGMLMMAPLRNVNWSDVTEALPAFLTMVMMAFGYGITEGIAMGCISFALVKTFAGRWRDVHPLMGVVAVLLLLRYILVYR